MIKMYFVNIVLSFFWGGIVGWYSKVIAGCNNSDDPVIQKLSNDLVSWLLTMVFVVAYGVSLYDDAGILHLVAPMIGFVVLCLYAKDHHWFEVVMAVINIVLSVLLGYVVYKGYATDLGIKFVIASVIAIAIGTVIGYRTAE